MAIVLTVVVLPLAVSLLLQIPGVQNWAVRRVAHMVSRKLETTVAVRRIDVGLLGKARIEGFYVEDYQRDTLFYVDRLDAYVTGLGIWGGGVTLSRGEISGAKLFLRETPEGEMNIKQVVNRISDPARPKKGNFRLTLEKASIEGMELCLERLEHRDPPYGIDFGHMHLSDMALRVDDFTIDGQAIYTTIEALSARERSGFVLDRFSGRFYLVNGCMGFEEATLLTARSHVKIPYISLVGGSWADYKDFVGEVRIDGALRSSTLSTDDIAYFSPKLRDWHTLFSEIDVDFNGTVADFESRIRSLRVGAHTSLAATASVRGLPDIGQTVFDLDISRLTASAGDLQRLAHDIARKELPENLVAMLGRAGTLGVQARFRGRLSSFDLRASAASEAGGVDVDLAMKPLTGGRSTLRGALTARSFRLGHLLGQSRLLGNATLTASIDGTVGHGTTDARVEGDISQLEFKGYAYDSLRLDGRLRNRGFDGIVTARDPALNFDFAGRVDFNDDIPRYDFTLDLRRADLAALHINPRDSVSVLAAHVEANAGGRSLDDLNGVIRVTDASYQYNDKKIETRSAVVTGENSAHSKFVELRSDFADVTFRSKTSYRTVFEYLRRSAWKYLPMLSRQSRTVEHAAPQTAVADDYSLLSVRIRDFNPVADAFASGLQVADGSTLQLLFNPASDQLSLRADSEYIERRRMLATRLNINASNRGDSLTVYASAEDLYAGALHLPHLSVTGGAKQNRMQLSTGFEDSLRRFSGLVSLRAEASESSGGRTVDLRILPSHITRGDKRWQIFANRIAIDTSRIVIDRFYVKNREQDLLLDGIASRSPDDSVTLRLRNFDLAPLTQIVERMGYLVEGRTNGGATMKSVLRGGEFTADIRFDSLEVNDIPAPPLQLVSRWNFARNRAAVAVLNREKRDTVVRGYFAPDRMRYYARLNVDSLDMGLLDPVLSGVVSSTQGLASAELVLQGERRNADLTGQVRVRGFRTTVDFTQVTYSAPEAVLDVKGNRFRAANVALYDSEGNRGRLDVDLNLQHLSNIAYDLRVTPDAMLVLNTTAEDNDFFYGRVYASGMARIKGDKGQVDMEIAAETDDDSFFAMPLSNKANISYADFVVFEKPAPADTLDRVMRKKLFFERRRSSKTAQSSRMTIALALDVRPNVEVELSVSGNAVKARGEGTLNLQIDPRSNVFEMYGDYTIREGSYLLSLQNIINKRFTIESGSTIQWTGAPMNAVLDIDAVYKLKASLQPLLQQLFQGSSSDSKAGTDRSVPVECVIHLGDRLSNPDVVFDVRVPSSDPETQTLIANALATPESANMQFLYLLLFNSFLAENNAASSSNIGASVSAATGLEFLSNQLSNWLSMSDYNLMIRYRPKSELTGEEVDFGLSKSLIDDRLIVELEGNYRIDNKQAVNNSVSNFMGEAYVTYLIDRAGTLKLKAFTQTIDRFDENQGLQETGVGIYYKEDFNNFRDFRRRVRERFTNKKRQARRAARKAEKARAATEAKAAETGGTYEAADMEK